MAILVIGLLLKWRFHCSNCFISSGIAGWIGGKGGLVGGVGTGSIYDLQRGVIRFRLVCLSRLEWGVWRFALGFLIHYPMGFFCFSFFRTCVWKSINS